MLDAQMMLKSDLQAAQEMKKALSLLFKKISETVS
jgi:hypothetical protein